MRRNMRLMSSGFVFAATEVSTQDGLLSLAPVAYTTPRKASRVATMSGAQRPSAVALKGTPHISYG